MFLGRGDRRDEEQPRRPFGVPCRLKVREGKELGEAGPGHRDRAHCGRVGDAAGGRVAEDAIARRKHRGESDKVRGGHPVHDQGRVVLRIRAHVLQREGFGMAFEPLEEWHVARQVPRIVGGEVPENEVGNQRA